MLSFVIYQWSCNFRFNFVVAPKARVASVFSVFFIFLLFLLLSLVALYHVLMSMFGHVGKEWQMLVLNEWDHYHWPFGDRVCCSPVSFSCHSLACQECA